MHPEHNPGPAGTQPIPHEWTIPARDWLPAGLLAEARQANERVDAEKEGSPVMRLWPREVFATKCGPQAEAVGPCPFCDILHQHGVSANPFRRLHYCATYRRLPFPGANRPEEVLVRFELDEPMPEDIQFELSAYRPDLLNLAEIARRHIEHRFLKNFHRRKRVTGAKYQGRGPWSRDLSQLAFQRIIDSHCLDEHVLRHIDNGMTRGDAERVAVAHFIRGEDGRDGISRLQRALLAAHRAAGQGDMSA